MRLLHKDKIFIDSIYKGSKVKAIRSHTYMEDLANVP